MSNISGYVRMLFFLHIDPFYRRPPLFLRACINSFLICITMCHVGHFHPIITFFLDSKNLPDSKLNKVLKVRVLYLTRNFHMHSFLPYFFFLFFFFSFFLFFFLAFFLSFFFFAKDANQRSLWTDSVGSGSNGI